MRGDAGIALMETMGGTLARQCRANALLQLIRLPICAEQIPQVNAVVAKQAKMQLPQRGDPQPVATGTEILAVGQGA